MRVYVDWTPQVIGATDEEGKLIGFRGCPETDCIMGEMDAALLGIQVSPDDATILTDSITTVRMVLRPGCKPHPRSKYPEKIKQRAKEIRDKLGDRQIAWIPRQANVAHKPLEQFWASYV